MEKNKILIADDQPEICSILERSLQDRGYATTSTFDGEEALHLLLADHFDLLVTDLIMPKRDGLLLIRDGRKIDPELEVIILTGYGALENAIEALRLGAFDYLQKPVDLKLFVHTVERALERRRLRLANRQLIAELRSAKDRLEQQRASELERIEQIGRALATNLQREQIVELLQQALLVNTDYGCEAVALLAWNHQGEYSNLAMRSRHRLARPVVEDIRKRMLQLADDAGGPPETGPFPETNLGISDKFRDEVEISAPLIGCDSERLPVQGKPMGVLAAFAAQGGALSLECRRVFHILAAQAAVALDSIALFEQVRDLAHRDGLTRLYNHLYFMDLLESEVRRARRYRRAVSLLFIDIDHFKQVNDRFGHQAGDQVLTRLARMLESCVRDTDLVGRYGGEEFVVLLPESTEREGSSLAERLRRSVEARAFDVEGEHAHITLSIGVASFFPEQVGTGDELVRAADEALLRAKGLGRNRVYSQLFNQVTRLDADERDSPGREESQ
jgi:diguanylate cyclase (GGDEF)-like protein